MGDLVEFNNLLLSKFHACYNRKLSKKLNLIHSMIHHVQKLWKVPKLGNWVPHNLTEGNHKARVGMYILMNADYHFEWIREEIFYKTIKWYRQWLSGGKEAKTHSKIDFYLKKALVSVHFVVQLILQLQ